MTGTRENPPDSQATLSTTLLERVRGREPQAWDRLVALYFPLVCRWGKQRGLTDDDALDVAQEVFGAVAQGIADFRRSATGDTFRGWLRIITRNKIIDHARKQQRQQVAAGGTEALDYIHQIAADFDSETSQLSPGETQLLVRRALELIRGDFEDSTWQLFWRFAIDGLTAQAVAAERGVSEWAVYKARSRVLARLKNELSSLGDEI